MYPIHESEYKNHFLAGEGGREGGEMGFGSLKRLGLLLLFFALSTIFAAAARVALSAAAASTAA